MLWTTDMAAALCRVLCCVHASSAAGVGTVPPAWLLGHVHKQWQVATGGNLLGGVHEIALEAQVVREEPWEIDSSILVSVTLGALV